MTLSVLVFLVMLLLTLDTLIVGVAVFLLLRFLHRVPSARTTARDPGSAWTDDPRLRP